MELTKTCPVIRPVFAFVQPTNRVNLQGVQELEIKQLGQNHHELRRYNTGHPSDSLMYCIYCARTMLREEWEAFINSPVANQ